MNTTNPTTTKRTWELFEEGEPYTTEAGRRDGARLVEEDFRERGSEAIRASLALAHINNAWEEDAAYGDAAGRRLYPVPARWQRAYYAALAERAEERARELLEHGMEPAL